MIKNGSKKSPFNTVFFRLFQDHYFTGGFIPSSEPPRDMSLEDTVRELEERLDMSRSEEVEETGRTVARLQD